MLSGRLSLFNVDDVEAFCNRIIDKRRLGWLLPHERDDLLCFLIETCWQESEKYRPQGYQFSQWVRPTLGNRVTDWLRKEFQRTRWQFAGHTYERPLTNIVSLEDSQVGRSFLDSVVDGTPDRSTDLVRVLGTRGSGKLGGDGGVGEEAKEDAA